MAVKKVLVNYSGEIAQLSDGDTIELSLDGDAQQYVRGDGSLAPFPQSQGPIKEGICTTGASTAAKVVTMPENPLPGDLVLITYTLGSTASSVTLNVNDTGPKNARIANANASSVAHYTAAGGQILYRYDGEYFHMFGSQRNSDANTTNTLSLSVATRIDSAGLSRQKFVMENALGTYTALSVGTGTANTKVQTATQLRLGGRILYNSSTGTIAANATTTGLVYAITGAQLNYTFNSINEYIIGAPMYLIGEIDAEGHFILDQTNLTSWYTQELPTGEDGKIYIRLGMVDGSNSLSIQPEHPVYWFKNGRVREYPDYGTPVTSVGLIAPTGLIVDNSPITESGDIEISYDEGYQGYTTVEANKLSGIAANATVGAAWATNLTGIPANITAWESVAPESKFNTPSGNTNQYIRGDGSLADFPTSPDVPNLQEVLDSGNVAQDTSLTIHKSTEFSPTQTMESSISIDDLNVAFQREYSGDINGLLKTRIMAEGITFEGSGGIVADDYYAVLYPSSWLVMKPGAHNTFSLTFDLVSLWNTTETVDVNVIIPHKSGTIALLEDLGNFVNTTGDQSNIAGEKTWTGLHTFLSDLFVDGNIDTSGSISASLIADSKGDVRKLSGRVANASVTLTDNDLNSSVEKGNSGSFTYTIPEDLGEHRDAITIVNSSLTGNITVQRGGNVELWQNGVNDDITVGPGSMITIFRSATLDRWIA